MPVWRSASIISALKGPLLLGPIPINVAFLVKLRKRVKPERFRIPIGKLKLFIGAGKGNYLLNAKGSCCDESFMELGTTLQPHS